MPVVLTAEMLDTQQMMQRRKPLRRTDPDSGRERSGSVAAGWDHHEAHYAALHCPTCLPASSLPAWTQASWIDSSVGVLAPG